MNIEMPPGATKVPRSEFDALARSKEFVFGPFMSSFGDGYGEPYNPPANRKVWGRLSDGRNVWADHE